MAESKELTRASKGGFARAERLSKEELSASARNAAEARWGADLPQATHDGPLQIGDKVLVAAVLSNGKRLLSQGTVLQAIGRSRTPKAGTGGFSTVDELPFFLQADKLKPFISEELRLSTTPILFRLKNGQRTVGYDAELLPMICEVYLNFRDALVAALRQNKDDKQAAADLKRYQPIIAECDRLTRGLARRGIIALVDDATGYQADKARDDALKIVEQYVSPSYLIPWTRRFPHEFFQEVYKILGWEYKAGSVKHPQYLGKFILRYIYDPLPPGVLDELKRRLPKNEKGNRSAKLWQALTEVTGIPHLDRQITAVVTLLEISDSKHEFERNFQRIFGRQRLLPLGKPPELEGAQS
jgi:P63C domain-containing protein